MDIGLYFGSFNPIHNGHLIIANHVLNNTELDQVWFVVSPQNPFKKTDQLLNEYHRFYLVQIACEGEARLRASDIEFYLPKPSYTADTLAYLKEKYHDHSFKIIMGSDSFQNLSKWKNADHILRNYEIFIYRRIGFEINQMPDSKMRILDAPIIEISASEIRRLIKEKKSIRYLVPDSVKNEIEKNHYYQ